MKTYESQIAEESLAKEVILDSYVPGIDNPIAILRDMNNNQEFDDDEVFFYTKDHLGSIRELVGLDGKLKQRQRYTAYGVTTREKNTDQLDRLIDHAYGFTGRELDSEIGMYFSRSRYLSLEMRRFINEDRVNILSGEINLYRYANNNPVKYSDPNGESPFAVGGAIAGAAVGLFAGGINSSACSIPGILGDAAIGFVVGGAGGFLAGAAANAGQLAAAGSILGGLVQTLGVSLGGMAAGAGVEAVGFFGFSFSGAGCEPPPTPPRVPNPPPPQCSGKK